jgi:hypothetical protein
MIINHTPEPNFTFDAQQLAEDFRKVQAVQPGKTSYWLTTLTKEASDDITAIYDTSYIRKLYSADTFKDPEKLARANDANLSIENFHTFMKGSYTHSVVLQIEADLRLRGKRLTAVFYHSLSVAKCYPMHTDALETRYHLPVVTNKNAFFMIEKGLGTEDYEIWNMPEAGKVYVFNPSTMHTAINAGYEDRVHLLIDYIDLK